MVVVLVLLLIMLLVLVLVVQLVVIVMMASMSDTSYGTCSVVTVDNKDEAHIQCMFCCGDMKKNGDNAVGVGVGTRCLVFRCCNSFLFIAPC